MRMVRLTVPLAMREGVLMAGSLYPCPDEIADHMIASGYAESVARECMTVEPWEVAIPPRASPRRRGSRDQVS